ncbi:MAG TPA: ATP-binding protein [Solirubrobacteraceae bacterium]
MELALPARAENIALIRHAFGALGEALAVNEELLSDVRLAVTEACSNVVVHAYDDDTPGPLEVLATVRDGALTVVVRDEGPGIAPHPDSPGLGLGLPLIASLAESVQLGRDEQERTEVCMTFPLIDGIGQAANPSGGNGSAAVGGHGAAADGGNGSAADGHEGASSGSSARQGTAGAGQDDRIDPTSPT